MSRLRFLSHVKYICDTAEEPTSANQLSSFLFHTTFISSLNLARYRELTGRTHVQTRNVAKQRFTREEAFLVSGGNEICCEVYIVEFPFVHLMIYCLIYRRFKAKEHSSIKREKSDRKELKDCSLIKKN